MRLTLRTLLAYMDDVLPPNETKQLGEQIRGSEEVQHLVSRIREVIRRRRLTAPELTGPEAGLDPNLVAGYLNDHLDPEQIVELERVMLDSDMYLAEVAACHQILTLALAEPVEITPAMKSRMYGLLEGAKLDVDPTGASHAAAPAAVPPSGPVHNIADERVSLPVAKGRPWVSKVLPVAAVLAVGAGWLSILANDPGVRHSLWPRGPVGSPPETGSPQVAQADNGVPKAPKDKPVAVIATNEPTVPGAVPPATPLPADAAAVSAPTVDPQTPSPPAMTGPETPAPGLPVASGDKPQPAGEMPAPAVTPPVAAPLSPVAPNTPTGEGANPSATPAPAATIGYTSTEGVLLSHNGMGASWFLTPRAQNIAPGTRVASLEPYEAVFEVAPSLTKLTMLGMTEGLFASGRDDAPFTFVLDRGRIILQQAAGGPATVWSLAIDGRDVKIVPSGPDAVVGIEVQWQRPTRFEQNLGANRVSAGLYMSEGSAKVTVGNDPARQIDRGMFLSLTTASQEPGETGALPPLPAAFPTWLDPSRRVPTPAQRRVSGQFEKEFVPGEPADQDMLSMFAEVAPRVEEMAINGLTLVGQFEGLVKGLAEADSEEGRMAAFNGLRDWLGQNPANGPVIKKDLARYYGPKDVDAIYRLLWGFDTKDARDKVTSLDLVGWMESPNVVIREMAFAHVCRLSDKRFDYRPVDTPSRREAAIQRWYKLLKEDGALLKSDPTP